MKKILYVMIVLAVFLVLVSCAKKNEEVKLVEEAIAEIGDVITEDSLGVIEQAKKLYSHLSTEDQDKVRNYSKLVVAQKKYEVADTTLAINKIGKVTLDSYGAIVYARGLFDALDQEYQLKVSNYGTLVDAERQYEKLREETQIYENIELCTAIINEINLNRLDTTTTGQIEYALQIYESIPAAFRNKVLNYSKLVTAQKKMQNAKTAGKVAGTVALGVLDSIL